MLLQTTTHLYFAFFVKNNKIHRKTYCFLIYSDFFFSTVRNLDFEQRVILLPKFRLNKLIS